MSQAMNMMTDTAIQNAGQANLDTQRSRLENLSKSQDNAAKERELRKAAEGFEAIFIQKMWDEMRSSLPKNGIHYSKEEEYWQSMYSQELGKSMASVGGIGLADMMVEQLTRPSGTPQTGALSRIRMAVKPAPLVAENGAENKTAENKANAVQTQKPAETAAQTVKPSAMNTAQFYEEVTPSSRDIAVQNVSADQTANAENKTAEKAEQVTPPQIIHTTYITNLPPNKRTNALLDAKGNPIKKAVPAAQNAKAEQTRTAGQAHAQRNNRTSEPQANFDALAAQNLDNIPEMPIVMHEQPKAEQTKAENSAAKAEPADMLAGISTTYIPYNQRIAMILASEGQRQQEERLEAERMQQIAENQSKAEPAFRLPSLEDALRMGTLVASLSPEEERQITAQAQAQNFETAYPEHIGGGAVLKNPPVAEFVSALAPQEDFAMPVDGTISSPFGWRIDPINHARAWHTGLDIQAESGSKVTASMAGTVTFAGEDKELGNMIIIDHGNGIESVYGHNSELLVKAGDTINTGTQIARVGASGRTNGSHLHFEIRQNGLSINPEPYFTKEEIS